MSGWVGVRCGWVCASVCVCVCVSGVSVCLSVCLSVFDVAVLSVRCFELALTRFAIYGSLKSTGGGGGSIKQSRKAWPS